MSSRESLIGFGLIIEGGEHNMIRKMQMNLANVTDNLDGLKQPPHITVKSPFILKNESDIEKLIEIVDKVASGRNSFQVILERFGVFENKVVYLRPSDGSRLASINTDIATALSSVDGYEGAKDKHHIPIFHVTIARNLSTIEFKKCMNLQESFGSALPIVTSIQKLGLFMNVDGQWIVIYSQDIDRK